MGCGVTRKNWTRREERQLVAWRRAGVKVSVCAVRLGRSVNSVKRKLSRFGVVLHPEFSRPRTRGAIFRALATRLRHGESVTDAADAVGVHYSYASAVRKRIGIPPASASDRAKRAWLLRRA